MDKLEIYVNNYNYDHSIFCKNKDTDYCREIQQLWRINDH